MTPRKRKTMGADAEDERALDGENQLHSSFDQADDDVSDDEQNGT